jgi:uncharacterized membrane protein
MRHATRRVSLVLVLACTVGTVALGTASKAPCASGHYGDGRQYRYLCYTDVVPLLGTEQLAGGRLPFLDACTKSENNCDEYPVLTMYLMRAEAWIQDGYQGFFYTNAVLMLGFALLISWCVWLLAGRRALWFALAPTLLIYATLNWDLAAVACATGALVAWSRRRDGWAGVLLGLGAAAKFYPALLLVPLFLQGLQDREPDRSIRLLWWSAGTWVAVNLPFIVLPPGGWATPPYRWGPWSTFFSFNGGRTPDFDSAWYAACHHVSSACISINNVNLFALTLFLCTTFVAILWKARRNPSFPRWTIGVPLLICFLLTNKVYSPQYSLWLLPWFALTMPRLRRFVAFEITDVAVFVTRFWFFGTFTGVMALPQQWWFEVALGARAIVLIWCVIGWVRDEHVPVSLTSATAPPPVPVLVA